MASLSKVALGDCLDGRFLLLKELGRGGMSTVFKALDQQSGQSVAVKVPLAQFASGMGSWSMFQREAQIGRALSHPGILRYLEQPSAGSYVVMEYIEGTPLSERAGKGRRLSEAEALPIMRELCAAVEHMHARGFVHYDLKPGNVIERADGTVCLIDLGMAHKIVPRGQLFNAPAPPMASADYVAPEQLTRRRGQPSVDIYALGAMLYEMVTGQAPFENDDPFVFASARQVGDPPAPRALVPELSPQIEEIVLRALRRKPSERYQSVAELRADLERPATVRVSGLAERLIAVTRWRKNLRLLRQATLVGVIPVALLVLSFRLLWLFLDHKP